MKLKPGTLGYAKLNGNWFKSVVVGQERTKLGIRFEPDLHARIIHAEEFVFKDKFESIDSHNHTGEPNSYTELPAIRKIWQGMSSKLDYWKRVLKFRHIAKVATTQPVKLRTGTVGWAKIQAASTKASGRKWRRCMVLEQEGDGLTICCSPELSVTTLKKDKFLIERIIEKGLHGLRFIDKLRLKKELRALNVPYLVNERVIFTPKMSMDNKGEMNQDLV